jgi:phosphoglycerol transferase
MRHASLFYKLHEYGIFNAYGPKAAWKYISKSYRGTIPFDGDSILETISKHGISLCLHKKEHKLADTPSMRLFEAAAAGSLIIADDIPFAHRTFGDTAFYLDSSLTESEQAEFIREKVDWANNNYNKCLEMTTAAKEIFEKDWSLEVLLEKACTFSESVVSPRRGQELAFFQNKSKPTSLDVIIRCGSRSADYVKRAIESVLNQAALHPRVLLVDYSTTNIFHDLSIQYPIEKVLYVPSNNTGYRSTALWDGMKAVTAEYFAVLDDDDTVEPDHWYKLINALEKDDDSMCRLVAYSGVIKIEEDGAYIDAVNFNGPLNRIIEETRELAFLDYFDADRLLKLDNYIQSNAWAAHSSILKRISLEDPLLEVAEDMYLYLEMLFVTDFIPVLSQTANWHWRSISANNSMLSVDQDIWQTCIDRIYRRLDYRNFRGMPFKHARLSASNRILSAKQDASQYSNSSPLLLSGDPLRPGFDFYRSSSVSGFHEPDETGIWSNTEFSWFVGYLSDFSDNIHVDIDFQAPPHFSGRSQVVKVLVNGFSIFSSYVQPWEINRVSADLALEERTNSLTFLLIVESVFSPSEHGVGLDDRRLGLHISKVRAVNQGCLNQTLESQHNGFDQTMTDNLVAPPKPLSWYLSNAVLMAKNGDKIKAKDLVMQFQHLLQERKQAIRNSELLMIKKIDELCGQHD